MKRTSAFRGRRVLITGHTGFKGSWLSLWLHQLGAQVSGYALAPPTTPSLFEAANVAACVTDRRGNICDVTAVRAVIEEFQPEFVFHLAAQSIVRESYREPVETYATNVVGTASLLDACRRTSSVRAIVVVTSDKCYENNNWVWGYRENDRIGGFDPYSSSKACAELVSDAFRRSYFASSSRSVGIATARAGNVIGGGDWAADRLVPDLVRAMASGRPAVIRNPGAVRPWQHVLDPLWGYLLLALELADDASAFSGSWNFGPASDSVETVESVVIRLANQWKGRLKWSIDDRDHPHEAARLILDSSKAASALHWRPLLNLDDVLTFSAGWYEACLRKDVDLFSLSESQIASYTKLIDKC